VTPLHRRLLRLEAVHDGRRFRHLSDAELDAALAAALADWLVADPGACPRDVEAEVLAFVAAHDADGAAR
jgi:hypothetical protein